MRNYFLESLCFSADSAEPTIYEVQEVASVILALPNLLPVEQIILLAELTDDQVHQALTLLAGGSAPKLTFFYIDLPGVIGCGHSWLHTAQLKQTLQARPSLHIRIKLFRFCGAQGTTDQCIHCQSDCHRLELDVEGDGTLVEPTLFSHEEGAPCVLSHCQPDIHHYHLRLVMGVDGDDDGIACGPWVRL